MIQPFQARAFSARPAVFAGALLLLIILYLTSGPSSTSRSAYLQKITSGLHGTVIAQGQQTHDSTHSANDAGIGTEQENSKPGQHHASDDVHTVTEAHAELAHSSSSDHTVDSEHPTTADHPSLIGTAKPALYQPLSLSQDDGETGDCTDRYGSGYVHSFSATATNMCDSKDAALTCFSHKAWPDWTDTFCVGQPATIDPGTKSIYIDCPLHNFAKDEQYHGNRAQTIDQIPESWYDTGPRHLFDKWIHLSEGSGPRTISKGPITLLVKREEGNVISNAWHVFMQMMSLWASLDILRSTLDPATGRPLYTDEDRKNTQVVVLDNDVEGAFYELWGMFGDLPTVRFRDLEPGDVRAVGKVVLPISGGSNPIWQSRTEFLPCNSSAMLRDFVNRVMQFYHIPLDPPPSRASGPAPAATPAQRRENEPLNLVFIDRRTQRHLRNQTDLLASLRNHLSRHHPHITLNVLDFAAYPFEEQLHKVRDIDILVGVHGAGLTHTMFLPRGATVVEIQPPGLKFFGFETLAHFLGHGYFQEYGDVTEYEGMTHNWQRDDVFISDHKFLRVVEQAIKLRGWREDTKERRLGYS